MLIELKTYQATCDDCGKIEIVKEAPHGTLPKLWGYEPQKKPAFDGYTYGGALTAGNYIYTTYSNSASAWIGTTNVIGNKIYCPNCLYKKEIAETFK